MTETVHTVTPSEIVALIVTCRKCGARSSLPMSFNQQAIECPCCKALLVTNDAVRAAAAIETLRRNEADACKVSFQIAE